MTLEFSQKHASVARTNLAAAGLAAKVEVIEGAALETLPVLAARGEPKFDMVFIDADKGNYAAYLALVVPMVRSGGLILADNVVRGGKVLDPAGDASAIGAAAFNAALAKETRVEAIVLQQVGIKGHDGLALARVR